MFKKLISWTSGLRFVMVTAVCMIAFGARADGINSGDITITDHLGKGYVSVAFGFYDDHKNDEYLRSDGSYIMINGVKAMVMTATNADNKPQNEGSSYWVRISSQNYKEICFCAKGAKINPTLY